jgi:hypothetical protein
VWLGASSTQPPTLFYAEKLGHDASAVNTPALMPANWPKVPSQLVQRKNEGPSMEGLLQLPPQAASQKIPLIAVETHCAFSLTGAGIRSLAQPVARPRDFFLGAIVSTTKHRLP